MASAAIEALSELASRLSVPVENDLSPISLLMGDDEGVDDFSSFPSLSLEESPGNFHTGNFANRSHVESHVESLLARPILLGKQDEEERSSLVDPESDSLDEFFVENFEEVPKVMMNNFCTSFATLMNSRLRANNGVLFANPNI